MITIQLLEDLAEAFVRIILLIPPAYTIISGFLILLDIQFMRSRTSEQVLASLAPLIPKDSKQDKYRTWEVQNLHVFVILDLAVFIQGQADQTVCNFWLVEHLGRVFLPHLEDDFCWGI